MGAPDSINRRNRRHRAESHPRKPTPGFPGGPESPKSENRQRQKSGNGVTVQFEVWGQSQCPVLIITSSSRAPVNEDAPSGPICAPFVRENGQSVRIGSKGPCVLFKGNTRSLRATRPLICPFSPKTGVNGDPDNAGSLTPFEMTLVDGLNKTKNLKLHHYRNSYYLFK